MSKNLIAWLIYAVFVVVAVYLNQHPDLFSFTGELALVKAVILLTYIGFVIYSFYCSQRENIFRSVASIMKLHWGRQICIDLYIGFLLSLFIIFLHEGLLVVALWALPILLFGNLATLLYFVIHFEGIIGRFIALG